jgi:phytoene dehydrogenase-like protein
MKRNNYLRNLCLVVSVFSGLSFQPLPSSSRGVGTLSQSNSDAAQNESIPSEPVDICVIGGGISGLTAAITAAESNPEKNDKILLLESSAEAGGRVSSERSDGFIFDKGFAVFIDAYPEAKALLDFDALDLQPFDPGALIKIPGKSSLARIADPRRQPRYLLQTLLTPVGTLRDKFRLIPLFLYLVTKNISDIFEDEEQDTLSILKNGYGFSDKMISEFFQPFLEGIYLCPLEEQSSRMFHFVMKMFIDGSATLPRNGMQAVSDQLLSKAQSLNVDVRFDSPVCNLIVDDNTGIITVDLDGGSKSIQARKVVMATEGVVAQKLLATLDDFGFLKDSERQPQRSIGCIYYSFESDPPISDPVLILNGERCDSVINNVCFPSQVSETYGSKGRGLCCVTILESTLEKYEGQHDVLDNAIRQELAGWFPDYHDEIDNQWKRERIYIIQNAQPSQYRGPAPANFNGGRDCTTFMGAALPQGIFVCGDHVVSIQTRNIIFCMVPCYYLTYMASCFPRLLQH